MPPWCGLLRSQGGPGNYVDSTAVAAAGFRPSALATGHAVQAAPDDGGSGSEIDQLSAAPLIALLLIFSPGGSKGVEAPSRGALGAAALVWVKGEDETPVLTLLF